MSSNLHVPDEQVKKHLHSDQMAWLSTVRKDNRPHCVPIGFQWDGETILIFSQPETQKIRNLRLNPQVVLSLADMQSDTSPVTIEGTAELLSIKASQFIMQEPEIAQAYAEKYADVLQSSDLTLDTLVTEYSQVIRITPTRFLLHG